MTHKTLAIGGLLALAAGASAQLTNVGPFSSTYHESFEGLPNYLNGGQYNTLSIFGGEGTLTAYNSVISQLDIYNPSGSATFGLDGGASATVVDGVNGLGLFNMASPMDVFLTLNAPVNYFGGFFADIDDAPIDLQFFNAASNPLSPVETVGNGTASLSWHGWYSASGISKIEFAGGLATAMDGLVAGNVAVATPEPGALAVLGLGVLGLLIRRRR